MDIDRRMQDREVVVDRLEVIKKLRENRAAHLARYEEGITAYPNAVRASLEAFQAAVAGLESTPNGVDLAGIPEFVQDFYREVLDAWEPPRKPECHSDANDRLLMILEADVRDTVTLSGREVACLLHDQWSWKHAFEAAVLGSVAR
jgi:hypothetical protein